MKCPITFRGPNGPASGVAAQHSQCFASWYGSVPGLKVRTDSMGAQAPLRRAAANVTHGIQCDVFRQRIAVLTLNSVLNGYSSTSVKATCYECPPLGSFTYYVS